MNRLSAGFITGIIGAVLLVVLSFVKIPYVSSILSYVAVIGAGIGAGILVARNPTFASKTGGAGALAGLVAGAVLFVASVITTIIVINSPEGQSIINQVYATVQASQTPTTGSSTTPVISKGTIQTFSYLGGCVAGLIYLGITTGLGAATGAIAGRSNQAPQLPLDANYPTFNVPPLGQTPPTPYGSQQGGYPPPQTPPQQ